MRENQIKAVLQRDLKKLLKSLGVYDAVCGSRECCYFCRKPLSLETISAVFPYDESVCFCCGRPECCNAMLNLEQEER